MNFRISVVMTTYNGEKYILKQLNSILNQTRRPDEVIICDDLSSDCTVDIIRNFIHSNNLNNWHLYINTSNIGWKKNFFEASKRATGDIVFFSDQDDIWLNYKIEEMSSIMISHDAGCVFGNKIIIDSNDNVNRNRSEKRKFSNKVINLKFKKSFINFVSLGCCMCLKNEIIKKYNEMNFPDGGHDSQCLRISLIFSKVVYFDKPVIYYRIHDSNSSEIKADYSFGSSTLNKRVTSINNNIIWLDQLNNNYLFDSKKEKVIKKSIDYLNKRKDYFDKKCLFISLIRFYSYYGGLTKLIGDFAYKHNLNGKLGRIRWKIRKK